MYLRAGALGSQECAGFPEVGITTGCELPDTVQVSQFELSRRAVGGLNFSAISAASVFTFSIHKNLLI